MSEKYWEQPFKWNEAAKKAGKPAKVFCASMADVFEDNPQVIEWRHRLFDLIVATPYLTWQLLTKRAENIMPFVPPSWQDQFPENVWMGGSAENQKRLEEQVKYLVHVPAVVRYLSLEPLLGPLTLPVDCNDGSGFFDWVIVGGESGTHARPMHPDWVRSLRDQCHDMGTSFFFKQWGEWYTDKIRIDTGEPSFAMWRSYEHFTQKLWAKKGDVCVDMAGDTCNIGQDFMHAEYPVAIMQRIGKGKSGHMLDGKEYREFPSVNHQP